MKPNEFLNQFKNLEKTGAFHQARTLDRMRDLLARVGNPHLKLPPTIVVAGSKGKGSTTHLIASILGAAGQRTGMYTSPHIERWNERIVAEGEPITDDEAAGIVEKYGEEFLRPTQGGERATYFEVVTAMAFLHFAGRGLETVVLEVGLGGTFDAVNVCDAPVAVITQLGLEHQLVLGGTLAQIAREKAGILRRGQYAVLEQQPIEATAVLWSETERVGAVALDAGRWMIRDRGVERTEQRFVLTQGNQSLGPLRLRLLGEHQLRNARLAVLAALAFCDKTARELPDEAITRGLFGVKVPVRMELIEHGHAAVPAESSAAKADWLLDGAHNRESAAALAAAVRRHFAARPVRLAIAMMRDKDPAAFLGELKILNPLEVIAVGMESDRAWSPHELTEAWALAGVDFPVRKAFSWREAAGLLDRSARANDLILVTGSLYLAGEARKSLLHHDA